MYAVLSDYVANAAAKEKTGTSRTHIFTLAY